MSAQGQTRKIRASPPHVRFAPFSRRTLRRVSTSELGQKRTPGGGQKRKPVRSRSGTARLGTRSR